MAIYQPYSFGAGIIWGSILNYADGTVPTNVTPTRLGVLQSMQLEFNSPVDELYGSYQFPLAIGRKTGKITAKCKFAQYSALALNNLYFGVPGAPTVNDTTGTPTQIVIASDEAHNVPATTTYTVTVTNSATFVADLGVRYGIGATTGLPGSNFQLVTSLTAAGQYTFSAGVYTFDSADASAPVVIDYTYNPSSGGYQTVPLNNYLLGAQPFFQAYIKTTYGGTQQKVGITFFQCVADSLSLPTKLDGFTIGDFGFNAIANISNGIGAMTFQYL